VTPPGPIILIADADPKVRLALGRHFDGLGFSVYSASDAEKTVQMLQSLQPEFVLLDVGLASVEQLGWIVKRSRVVLMAPARAAKLARAVVAAGAVDFSIKPVDPIQVERTVRWHLRTPKPAVPKPRPKGDGKKNEHAPPAGESWGLWLFAALGLAAALGAVVSARLLGLGPWKQNDPVPAPVSSTARPAPPKPAIKEEKPRVPDPEYSLTPPPLPGEPEKK
jgi:CheY-like chemotaxis protein